MSAAAGSICLLQRLLSYVIGPRLAAKPGFLYRILHEHEFPQNFHSCQLIQACHMRAYSAEKVLLSSSEATD
jgi:hypothetical protein